MSRSLSIAAVILLFSFTPLTADIVFVDAPPSGGTGTDFRIAEVTGVDISGTEHDVTFHHGVSFDSLTDPITFADPIENSVAVTAVADAINNGVVDASGFSDATFFHRPPCRY